MISSTPKQRQLIGCFRKLLKIDDDLYYYEMLNSFNVKSSKDLNYTQAGELINNLKFNAIELNLYNPKAENDNLKFNNLASRQGFATPKQLRLIDVLWKNVSIKETNKEKEKALNSFIERITGKKRLNFLTQKDVSKVIKAIKAMEK